MKEELPAPSELRLVSTVPFPDHLFAGFAKIKPDAGTALSAVFNDGKKPSKILGPAFDRHLSYTYELGERGLFWEAGPAADFSEILYIFSTSSLTEARRLMRDDPLYREGIFFEDWWFEWHVHVPPWKIRPADREMMEGLMRHVNILPAYPAGVRPSVTEIRVEPVTPLRLFVSLSRARAESIKKMERDEQAGRPVPAFLVNHAYNRLGPGGTVQMGYDWEAGPSMDQAYDLTIMSVSALQMAQQLRENDPMSQHGLFYDHRYFEWCILTPFSKVSPAYRDTMKRLLRAAGVAVPETTG
jgi:uncharacterized protein YciI